MIQNLSRQSDLQWILSRYLHSVNGRALIFPAKDYPIKSKSRSTVTHLQGLECAPLAPTEYLNASRESHLLPYDETFILGIPNGKFIDDASLIIDEKSNSIFHHQAIDSVYGSTEWVQQQTGLQVTSQTHLPGNVLLLSATWGAEYSHFIFNVIGKYRKFLQFPMFMDEIDYIVLPENKPYIAEWLSILNLPKEKIVHLDSGGNNGHPGCLVSCENLIVPSSGSVGDIDTIAFLRNTLLHHLPKRPAHRLIYSSRLRNAKQRGRHILNDDELFSDILKPLGFEYIIEEELSIREKAQIFNQAKFVISPMGSGSIAHFSFMQKGSYALEILGAHWVDYINGDILGSLGINYFYHVTEDVIGNNMRVDKNSFRRMVNHLIQRQGDV